MAVSQVTSLTALTGGSSVITNYSKELRRKAVLRDIYTNLRAKEILYEGQRMALPNGIYGTISPKDASGANNIRVTLKLPINANILRGNAVAVNTEVAPELRTGTLYRNNYRFVVQDEPGYGNDKLDAAPYSLYQTHVDDLGPHAGAEEGLEIRMALVETNGWNLMVGATAAVCPAQWNRNFFVAGLTIAQQPAFHPNYATYTNRLASAINQASGGNAQFAQTAAQMLNGIVMDQLGIYAIRRRMTPLTIDGRHAFVLTISDVQAARFSNPTFTDTLGNRWQAAAAISEKEQSWYGILGRWRSAVGCDIYVVVDERLPVLLPSGSAEPFGLAAFYNWPTDNEDRPFDNPILRDASILHGRGAVVNFEPEKMHYINDNYDYNIRNGYGYAGVRGIQQLQFDTTPQDATGAAREYYGSAVVVLGRHEGY
jgi:hypothetical protein